MPSSHGPECGGKAYPSTCAGCRRDIFYFYCGHGSKVFFDELGNGWPRHNCKTLTIAGRTSMETSMVKEIARRPRGGVFEDGAFPGILVYHGGYTRSESPIIQGHTLKKCKRCLLLQWDPTNCVCRGKLLTKEQDERLRAKRRLARGVVSGYLEQAASEDRKRVAIGTVSHPQIRTASDKPTRSEVARRPPRGPARRLP